MFATAPSFVIVALSATAVSDFLVSSVILPLAVLIARGTIEVFPSTCKSLAVPVPLPVAVADVSVSVISVATVSVTSGLVAVSVAVLAVCVTVRTVRMVPVLRP